MIIILIKNLKNSKMYKTPELSPQIPNILNQPLKMLNISLIFNNQDQLSY